MVVILIGLITFVLGCVITYYFDHSGKKESEKSNIELKEDAIRARQGLQDQQDNLMRLLDLAIRDSVDETVKSMATIGPAEAEAEAEAQRGDLDRRQLYNRAYDEVKRNWSRMSEIVSEAGENGEVVAPRKMDAVIPLPEKLDVEKSRFASQPPPTAEGAITTSIPVVELEDIGGSSEPQEITRFEEVKEDTDLEERDPARAEPTPDEPELNDVVR